MNLQKAAVRSVAHGDGCTATDRAKVEDGCGCVFCDLDLEPYFAARKINEVAAYWHDTKHGAVKCTKPR